VFEALNQFCAVDLSALYIDITKDRMYCDPANAGRRRATQAAMHACFDAVTRLLAPILAYTADEAWEFAGHAESVHLETFPEAGERDLALEQEVGKWLELRGAVYQQAIEPARQAKTISKSLEAVVELSTPAKPECPDAELAEFFIVSEVTVSTGEPAVKLVKSPHHGCARCWRFLPDVDADSGLCQRCADAVQNVVTA
jgi:isoleucyl-tRNA synthetase